MLLKRKIEDYQVEEEIKEDLPEGIKVNRPRRGLTTWKNPANGFFVCRTHYTADDRKNKSKEWKQDARKGLSYAEWMREYEIVWSSFEGLPVYMDDFSPQVHVSYEQLNWTPNLPVLRGWDFGLGANGMACVFAQLLPHGKLWIYKELVATDTDIENFTPEVRTKSLEWFPGCYKYIDIVDPSSINRSQIDKRSCVGIVKKILRTQPVLGEKSKIKRRQAVVDYLKAHVKGQSCFLVDYEGCKHLVEGFEGGYHYAIAKDGQPKEDPEKNEYSHDHDALQMIASKAAYVDMRARTSIKIAEPKYDFSQSFGRKELIA